MNRTNIYVKDNSGPMSILVKANITLWNPQRVLRQGNMEDSNVQIMHNSQHEKERGFLQFRHDDRVSYAEAGKEKRKIFLIQFSLSF